MTTKLNQHIHTLLQSLDEMLWRPGEVRILHCLLALFLDTRTRTILKNIKGTSVSTASRFFNFGCLEPRLCWSELAVANREMVFDYLATLSGRHPDVVLKVDLTCIEKTGRKLPFVWRYNHRQGVQVVVLHVSVGSLHLPLAERIYPRGSKKTPTELALDLLNEFPAGLWPPRVVVMADAGFGSKDFLIGCRDLGFTRVLLGIKSNRKLADGRLPGQAARGEQVALHDLPGMSLWLSWCRVRQEDDVKCFFVVSTFKATGAYLAKRYRLRWFIESFFQRAKHDFGLKEARIRTQQGMRLWIFLSCLAFSIASSQRSFNSPRLGAAALSLGEAARIAVTQFLKDTLLHSLMSDADSLAQLSGISSLKLVMHGCNS